MTTEKDAAFTPMATKLAGAVSEKNEHLYSSFKLVHNGEFDADIISKQDIP